MTGISTATLRSWERRYGVPTPARTLSSYRLYSDSDVALLLRMRDLCREGMSPAEASKVVTATVPEPARGPAEDADHHLVLQGRIVEAVRRFDPEGVEAAIRQAMLLSSSESVLERVLVPAMREVGQMWHDGLLTVGHEHMLSEIATRYAREAVHLAQPGSGAPRVLLACFADEEHTFPLYVVAHRFAQWGYRTAVLGARTPPDALGEAVQALSPEIVALSVSIPPGPRRGAELVLAYAEAVGDTPWIVGGSGVNGMRSLITESGGITASEDPEGLKNDVRQALTRTV
jgi:DNA-binding transcriptional MerR regulator/methylmalonyl-CoA mutase cobalamin-binding subunit